MNDACNNSTNNSIWLVEDKVTGQVSAAFLLLILVVGFPWNLLVVLTIVKEKLYHQPTILLLLNLAVNDIIMLSYYIPTVIVTGFAGEFIFGDPSGSRCKWCDSQVSGVLFVMMSLYNVFLLAFDRFLYIYKPMRYQKLITCMRTVVLLIALWIFLVVISALFHRIGKTVVFMPEFLSCSPNYDEVKAGGIIVLLVIIALPIVGLVVFNVWVLVIVQKNIRAIYNVKNSLGGQKDGNPSQNNLYKALKKKRQQKELHMIQVFGALLGSNLISWLPSLGLSAYYFISGTQQGGVPTQLVAVIQFLFASQIAVHPIIETILIKDVREPMKKLFLCHCCCKRETFELSSEESGRSLWSCERSGFRCCSEFMSVLHDAVLEYSRHSHPQQGETQVDTLKTETKDI